MSNSYRRHPLIEESGLLRIRPNRFGSNHASGRVLRKIGIVRLYTCPGYYEKWDNSEGREEYCLLVRDWREPHVR